MSLLKKIILAGAVGLTCLTGCVPEPDAVTAKSSGPNPEIKTDQRYVNQDKKLLAEFGELEKITTQITDIQDGFAQWGNTGLRPYKFIEANGGDAQGLVLIYPSAAYFRKFTPTEITFKRLKNRKITVREFMRRYAYQNVGVGDQDNHVIEADGIIEPDGVKYLGESK